MPARFVPLHLHSEYSLRDSLIRLPEKPEHGDPAKAPAPAATSLGTDAAVTDPNKKKKDLVAAAIARINALDGRPKG